MSETLSKNGIFEKKGLAFYDFETSRVVCEHLFVHLDYFAHLTQGPCLPFPARRELMNLTVGNTGAKRMGTPLHARVEQQILGRIQNGDWPVGSRLPKEEDLATELGVSRSTLRLAFSSLERKGMLLRKKRAGTRVISAAPKPRFSLVASDSSQIMSLFKNTKYEFLGSRSIADGSNVLISDFRSDPGFWLELTVGRVLHGDTTPFSWKLAYIPGQYSEIERYARVGSTSVVEMMDENFGMSLHKIKQQITSLPCPPMAARGLGLSEGEPVTQIITQIVFIFLQVINHRHLPLFPHFVPIGEVAGFP